MYIRKQIEALVENKPDCWEAQQLLWLYTCLCNHHFSISLTLLSLLLSFLCHLPVLTVMVSTAVAAIYSKEFLRIQRPGWLYKIVYFSPRVSA